MTIKYWNRSTQSDHLGPQDSRCFRYEIETNKQPIIFNFDVEFCPSVLLHNQMVCLNQFEILVLPVFTISAKLDLITCVGNFTSVHFISMRNYALPSVTAFYKAGSSSSYFTVERAAKTLHRMSPCTLVSVRAKITWLLKVFALYELMTVGHLD